jgi:hypothetical protein
MKEKIIEMIKHYDQIDWNISCVGPSEYLEVLADQILALFISNPFWKDIDRNIPSLEGIEHVEKCDYCKDWTKISANCPYCHGTGEITRQAEWGEVMEMVMYCFNPGQIKLFDIDRNGNIQFILKLGGKLRQHHNPLE